MIYPEVYLCCSTSLALPSKIQFYQYSSYTLSTFCLTFPIYLETCYLTVFPYIGLNAYSDIKASSWKPWGNFELVMVNVSLLPVLVFIESLLKL